jgi:hypothetical protein
VSSEDSWAHDEGCRPYGCGHRDFTIDFASGRVNLSGLAGTAVNGNKMMELELSQDTPALSSSGSYRKERRYSFVTRLLQSCANVPGRILTRRWVGQFGLLTRGRNKAFIFCIL